MLLNAVIIILQEVLEAALLISVLLALSHALRIPLLWLAYSVAIGIGGAFIYQLNLESISAAFDYVGQEVTNAGMQTAVYLCLAMTVFCLGSNPSASQKKCLFVSMIMAVSLGIIREGSEIFIYIGSFLQQEDDLLSVCLGGIVGAAIGTSLAALIYYTLISMPLRHALTAGQLLLALVGAAQLGQGTQLLIQADWLPSYQPLWDSSALLSEDTITGQLLYAIAGYEATPGAIQLGAYLFALGSIIALLVYKSVKHKNTVQKNTIKNNPIKNNPAKDTHHA